MLTIIDAAVPVPFEMFNVPPEISRFPPIVSVKAEFADSRKSWPFVFWILKSPAIDVSAPAELTAVASVGALMIRLPKLPEDIDPLDGPAALQLAIVKLLAASNDSEPARIVAAIPLVLLCT